MAETLVIVESPAKAKTIGKYLGRGYVVKASMGHVRDLPTKELGIAVDDGSFAPHYVVSPGKLKTLNEFRQLAKEATRILLATDPDREGEAIAWHILTGAGLPRQRVQRVEFHEITASAINKAINQPRALDMNLVNAQQARRVLDRLVGYKISPLLWSKIKGGKTGLSAGRVQSVAVRVVVEREREIEQFVPREFWTVEADLAKSPWSKQKKDVFRATLVHKEGKEAGKKREFETGEQAQAVVEDLEKNSSWQVAKITKKEGLRRPSPPFITSTMQQEASRKLGFPSKRTMQIAQQLYEGVSLGSEGSTGLITYMRTDSTNVATEAQQAARSVIKDRFGVDYLPSQPPVYAKKVAGAQEAHEAIRPTSPQRDPEMVKGFLTFEQYRLYRLIWQRFIASQMSPARVEQTVVDIDARPQNPARPTYLFQASGERILFPGFLAVYREGIGDSEGAEETPEERGSLPLLGQGDLLDLLKLLAEQHFTQPPPRYGEASLVKALEELGVGRPSTYATILDTIQARGYVIKFKDGKEQKFRPTSLGKTVNDLLVARFPDVVDVKFTARLENELDEVADGKRPWVPLIADFYAPLIEKLKLAEREVTRIEIAVEPGEEVTSSTSYSKGRSSGRSYPARTTRKTTQPRTTSSNTTTRKRTTKPKAVEANPTKPASKPKTADTSAPWWDDAEIPIFLPDGTILSPEPKKITRTKAASKTVSETPTVAKPATKKPATKPASMTSSDPSSPVCDKCGKPMVKRKSQYGEFWGCSGFPNCRSIKQLSV